MTRIWLVNWHFQSRITLWCRHKSTNVSMGLCSQMPKFIIWRLWFIYFDHHLLLKPSIGKRRKQSCTPNIYIYCIYIYIYIYIQYIIYIYIYIYMALWKSAVSYKNLSSCHKWHSRAVDKFNYSKCGAQCSR